MRYLLRSAKGGFIYSPQYKEIIAATPYINYRSVIAWVFVALVVVAIVLMVLVFLIRLIGIS
ncbi:MAG: hypothetical protein FJ308_20030 [Planctomycetes bacterium]|nr:hypothetical protein [Planctomycetota bacterium]